MRGYNNPGQKDLELNIMGSREIYFSDIVGQEGPKKEAEKFMTMLENRELVNYYGLEIPNMAFFGPPGTGKTLLAQAMAHKCINNLEDTLFVSLNLQSFATCFINETSNNFDNYMKLVKSEIESPEPFNYFVVFVDEYDSIGRTRGIDIHGEDDKLVNTINAYIDGERKIEGVNYLIVSNFPELIDQSQKNRFGIHGKFELFKNEQDKIDLFRVHERRASRRAEKNVFEEIDYSGLVKKLKGEISGREIRDINYRTIENKLFSMINSGKTIEDNLLVNQEDFEQTIKEYITERRESEKVGF